MRRVTLLAIVGAIMFLNTPETHPQFMRAVAEHGPKLQEALDKTVGLVYTTAYQSVPILISVNGETIKTVALNTAQVDTSEDLSLTHGNSLTAEQFDAILTSYNPSIEHLGQASIQYGEETRIDNAYVLAMFIKESTAGQFGYAALTKSTGNIICAGYATCIDRFRSYPSWQEGLHDHFRLLKCYREPGSAGCDGLWNGKAHTTIEEAIDTWAPPSENNTNQYREFVVSLVREWRKANKNIQPAITPTGSPLKEVVITQGYDVGTHAPAAIWGGIDLAADEGTPIYATHDGIATVRENTWPAGNYLAIVNERYKTAYAHLSKYNVVDGQSVKRGDIIGYTGSTGQVTGPHLHYEIWDNGVNVNPEGFMK